MSIWSTYRLGQWRQTVLYILPQISDNCPKLLYEEQPCTGMALAPCLPQGRICWVPCEEFLVVGP